MLMANKRIVFEQLEKWLRFYFCIWE